MLAMVNQHHNQRTGEDNGCHQKQPVNVQMTMLVLHFANDDKDNAGNNDSNNDSENNVDDRHTDVPFWSLKFVSVLVSHHQCNSDQLLQTREFIKPSCFGIR